MPHIHSCWSSDVRLQALTVGAALMPLTRLTCLSLKGQKLRLSAPNPELQLPPSLQHLNLEDSL